MNPKLQRLIETLLDRSRSNLVEWHAVGDDQFRTEIAGGLIRIWASDQNCEDQYGDTQYDPSVRIVISDHDANVVFNEEVVKSTSPELYVKCHALLREARSGAFNGTELLDTMLSTMGEPVR